MEKRYYWGFRYWGTQSTTYENSKNQHTGRYSIAGDAVCFRYKEGLDLWLSKENLCAPCGCGGGIREQVTLKKLRKLTRGLSGEQFAEMITDLKEEATK